MKIVCLACGWVPTPASRWRCSCGFRWNTFDTVGVLPQLPEAMGRYPMPSVPLDNAASDVVSGEYWRKVS